MESTAFSLDIAQHYLLEEGFFDLGDPKVGADVSKFEQKEFPFYTEDGMDFLKQHILSNSVSRIKYSMMTI
jgi:hypothetical protein